MIRDPWEAVEAIKANDKSAVELEKLLLDDSEIRLGDYLDPKHSLYLYHVQQLALSCLSGDIYAHSNQEFYRIDPRKSGDLTSARILRKLITPLIRGQSLIVDLHGDIAVKCSRQGDKRRVLCSKHPSCFW